MGQTELQKKRSGGLTAAIAGEEEEKNRPEGLAVLLTLCGRLTEGQVLLGELLAESVALGKLTQWRESVAVRSNHAVVPDAATGAAATAVDGAAPNASGGRSNDEETQAESQALPSPPEKKETRAAATSTPSAAVVVPPTAHLKASSAAAEVSRQVEAFSAEASAVPLVASTLPPSSNHRSPNTSTVGIVLDSPPHPQAAAAAAAAAERSRHRAAVSSNLAHESVFDNEADFLAKSAAEQAERGGSGGGDGYFLDAAGRYLSGFASSFAPPASVSRGNAQTNQQPQQKQQQQQRFQGNQEQQQQQRRHGEQRTNSQEVGGAAAPPGTSSVSITGLPSPLQAPSSRYEQPAAEDIVIEQQAAAPGPTSIVRYANLMEGQYTVVLFDLETTGLNADNHRIIQIAAKVRRGGGGFIWPGLGVGEGTSSENILLWA